MKPARSTRPSPDREAAPAQYRRRAGHDDLELALFEPLRRRAIARLALLIEPWHLLNAQLDDFEVEPAFWGGAYLACGRLKQEAPHP